MQNIKVIENFKIKVNKILRLVKFFQIKVRKKRVKVSKNACKG